MSDVESDLAFTNTAVSKNYARFYPKWVRNNFKSKEQGIEVGEYQDFVLIISPGQKDEVHRKANEQDQREYPNEYRSYKDGKEHRISGTPIDLLPGIDVGRIASLKSLYIYSVEQLAELSDLSAQKVGMGAAELRKKAQDFINRKPNNDALTVRIAELEALVKQLSENQKKKPGRKKEPQ
jgi:hypothetical protein